jgi:hypothetical protein
MLTSDDLKTVQKLIEDFKPKVGFFEKEILIPGIEGRLEYILEIFGEFQKICKERDVATHIDAPLRKTVNPELIKLGVPEPKVGEQYLSIIHKQIDDEYVFPIKKLLDKYKGQDKFLNIDKMVEYLNDVSNTLISIPATKSRLFRYSLRSFPNIKKLDTGEVIIGPPQELSLVMMPFETRIEELANVAQTTIDSIKEWANQIRDQKSKHVDSIAHVAQVKAATENFRASQEAVNASKEATKVAEKNLLASEESVKVAHKNLIIQISVIVFTIVAIIISQRVNLLLELWELDKALELKNAQVLENENMNQKLTNEMALLKISVGELKEQKIELQKENEKLKALKKSSKLRGP